MPSQPRSTPSGAPGYTRTGGGSIPGFVLLQSGFGDQRADLRRTGGGERDVGGSVVAVRNHGLQGAAGLGGAGKVEEDGAAERAHRIVHFHLLVFRQAPGFDLAQVLRQDEGLDRAADEHARAGSCAARHGAPGWSTATRQLAVAGMRAKRSTAACTSAAPSAATARLIKTSPASAEAPSANMRRRSRFMAIPLLVTASVSAATDSITAVGDVQALAAVPRASVADLTFLSALPRVIHRNVKSKATLEII